MQGLAAKLVGFKQHSIDNSHFGFAAIKLREREHLFQGKMRDVYQHPSDENCLIKVIRSHRVGKNNSLLGLKKRKITESFRKYGLYLSFMREIEEMLLFSKRVYPRLDVQYPVARVFGFIETDLGLGLIVEKIRSSSGAPAPTLRQLKRDGRLSAQQWQRLDAFFDLCERYHIVAGDLHLANIVFEDRGAGRFVCIDGVGEKAYIPVHRWFGWVNTMKLRRIKKRIETELGRYIDRQPATSSDIISTA